ncbi:rho GTPase-activating gacO-like protein [Perilla frutescens var. hirtella]|uniref:Rho GTPase-activating gacO-like protein n=1 Tax=Perilla frutescens var. hirtella TaxID=608512 RepID=A0AAD4IMG0_PERFH|nr:rho GTPase-activating gacO-like protein [Perilla frutescens var. hirtella]
MGRGREKERKQSAVADHDDTGSGEDEKLPMRRRGRPQKPLKGEIEEEDKIVMIEKEDDDVEETYTLSKKNGRKRKRASCVEKNVETVKEENGVGAKTSATDSIKSIGDRSNGSRRKNKPRRAAEAGVECQ